ncbi:MAG: DUF547 domain-containing protein [Candidatus Melainabacteria bacterium]|nr:DUF547 domain-containing protein [Candidatus Melainabacteria bacterium]
MLTKFPALIKYFPFVMIAMGLIFMLMHAGRVIPAAIVSIVTPVKHPTQFTFDTYDKLLRKYVSADGLVDYTGLKKDPRLGEAVKELARMAPDKLSYQGQVCYWINAHNLLALKIICDRYPIKSTAALDVDMSARKFDVGGEVLSVQKIFRLKIFPLLKRSSAVPEKIFLVCAGSVSYPPLTDHAIEPDGLDADARAAAYKYITNPKNVYFDNDRGIFYIAPLLKRYEPILSQVGETAHGFAALYMPSDKAPDMTDIMITRSFFKNVDLRLNDRAAFKSEPQVIDDLMR